MAYPTAAKVERHLAHRTHLVARLAQLAKLLAAWDEWDVDQLLPLPERRLRRRPEGGREVLTVLHEALRTELEKLDAAPVPEEPEPVAVTAG